MNRKAPTPIRSAPSSAPLETMVTKQQAHIDELVSKNRATEQAIQKLKSEIDHERHRHENTLQQFVQEREEWKGAADSLQGLWRIAYLRGVTELEAERMNVFKMKEELRRMRMARLQRDYQIGMFQAKELETENRIVDLQERIQDAEWMYEEEHSQRIHLKEQLQEDAEGLQEIRDERDQLEKSLSGLRIEHTTLLATSGATSTSLERATLKVEGLQASLTELQDKYTELERTNSDLLRQLEKWRKLDKREGDEAGALRKAKIELEVQVKELENSIEEMTTVSQARDEKFKNKIDKYKESLKEHADAIKERDDELDQRDSEIADLKQKLLDAVEEASTLGVQVDEERKKAQTLAQQAKKLEVAVSKVSSKPSDPPPAAKPKPKPRPVTTTKKGKQAEDDSDVVEEPAKPSKSKQKAVASDIDDDEIEVIEKPIAKKKTSSESRQTKSGAKKQSKGKSPSPEVEIVAESSVRSPRATKRKPASKNDEDDDDDEPALKKRKKASGTANTKTAPKAKKGPKGKSHDFAEDSDSEVEPAQKKKKRKINIFPNSTFNWGDLPQGDGGLNIPTELSPVKTTSIIPSRAGSNSSRSFASIGGRR